MENKLELLLLSYSIDEILEQNDIEPLFVLEWLVENDMVNLEEYF